MPENYEVRLRVTNSKVEPITFTLEPWGETYAVEPDETLSLVFDGPADDGPEVDWGVERITVWAWTGSTVKLFRGTQELGAGPHRPRVPGLPRSA